MNNASELTPAQKTFLATVSAWIDEDDIGKKIDLTWDKERKCARLAKREISINLQDRELLQLARLGFLELYLSSTPRSIVFKKTILESNTDDKARDDPPAPLSDKVTAMDIFQVYAWLVVSIAFAIFTIVLLGVTAKAVLDQRISASMLSGITTLVTSVASIVFFKNYDKANDRLKRFRSDPSNKRR